jgi:hypothetical protein
VSERTTDAAASEPETAVPTTEPPTDAPEVAEAQADGPGEPTADERAARTPAPSGQMPEYKGEPLDAERGPGLGCFWVQVALLAFFLVFTPLTVTWGWPPLVSAALLIFTLILLLFSGQTIIFLLRLVAADRRTRRAPLNPSAKPTVGQMEDVAPASEAGGVSESEEITTAGEAVTAAGEAATAAGDAASDLEPDSDEKKPADG